MGGCKILNDLFDRIYVPNKTEVLRLNVFNMITAINDSKTLTKHTKCESKWNFDGRRRNSNQNWNNDKCRCKRENTVEHQACEKDYMWNPVTWTGKNGWYTGIINDDSVLTYDKYIITADRILTNVSCSVQKNTTNTAAINFDDQKVGYEMDCFVLLKVLLLFNL